MNGIPACGVLLVNQPGFLYVVDGVNEDGTRRVDVKHTVLAGMADELLRPVWDLLDSERCQVWTREVCEDVSMAGQSAVFLSIVEYEPVFTG